MKKQALLPLVLLCLSAKAQVDPTTMRNDIKKKPLTECEILVTPNPSNGDIRINAPVGSSCMLSSSKGTYIGTWRVEDGGFKLEGMSSGAYIAIIKNGKEVATRKFVVL